MPMSFIHTAYTQPANSTPTQFPTQKSAPQAKTRRASMQYVYMRASLETRGSRKADARSCLKIGNRGVASFPARYRYGGH
jgi:hypothetical protein